MQDDSQKTNSKHGLLQLGVLPIEDVSHWPSLDQPAEQYLAERDS
ncbi:hypothetical protein [Streptomyces omiyaensis]